MPKIIGAITIGQSPRVDLIPEIQALLEPEVRVIEAGALDGMTLEEVERLRPGPGDEVLVTRMADGTPVRVAERHIIPRIQAQIDLLVQRGADVVALACTGEFPEFRSPRMILRPQRMLWHVTASLAHGYSLGVMVPDPDQVASAERRWQGVSRRLAVRAASPYADLSALDRAARSLREWGTDLVVMDCIGYTLAMKTLVKGLTGVPVILARSVLARVMSEIL